jgi:hypothetical protein
MIACVITALIAKDRTKGRNVIKSVKDEAMFRSRSRSFKFLYQKRSGEPEQSEPKMNNSPCSSRGQRQGAAIAGYVPGHGLHPDSEGKSLLVTVTPVGDYMDRILGLA